MKNLSTTDKLWLKTAAQCALLYAATAAVIRVLGRQA